MEIDFVRKASLGGQENVRATKRYKGVELTHSVADVYKVSEHAFQELREEHDGFDLRRVRCQLDNFKFDIEEIQFYCWSNNGGYNITLEDMIANSMS